MNSHDISQRLERIELILNSLVSEGSPREFYSPNELAQILGRAEFTVREWCRLGRIHAQKRKSGQGWMISHDELTRIKNEGLLPL